MISKINTDIYFIACQPLQYLQALELFDKSKRNILIVFGRNTDSIKEIIYKDDWDEVHYYNFNGNLVDLVRNRRTIKFIFRKFQRVSAIVVSSYYNEFINFAVNSVVYDNVILLEDGLANRFIDSSTKYSGLKYKIKRTISVMLGIDIKPIESFSSFTIFFNEPEYITKKAKFIIPNYFDRLREKIVLTCSRDDYVLVVNSAYIAREMIDKSNYLIFLDKLISHLINQNYSVTLLLHRADEISWYKELNKYDRLSIVKSNLPVEVKIYKDEEAPKYVITTGGAATETLPRIYGIPVFVAMPKSSSFFPRYRSAINALHSDYEAKNILFDY